MAVAERKAEARDLLAWLIEATGEKLVDASAFKASLGIYEEDTFGVCDD